MLTRGTLCTCLLVVCFTGCKQKDQAPPPLASATPEAPVAPAVPPPTPAATATAAAASDAATAAAAQDAAAAVGDAAAAATADADAAAADGGTGKKAVNPAASIKGCCAALGRAAAAAEKHVNRYKAAAAVCNGLAQSVNAGTASPAAARTTLRAQLQGIPIPGGC